jgi:hypothetical protein
MCSLDLEKAYLTVPINHRHWDLFRFCLENRTFRAKTLFFGVNMAPRVFTLIMRIILGPIREAGIRVIAYLDDLLIIASSQEQCLRHTQTLFHWILKCGFVPNLRKSELVPTQQITFLGCVLDSVNMNLSLPHDKVTGISRMCRRIAGMDSCPRRILAQLKGQMVAAAQAVLHAPLHYQELTHLLRLASRRFNNHQWDTLLPLTSVIKTELLQWSSELMDWNGKSFRPFLPDFIAETDASLRGFGAVIRHASPLMATSQPLFSTQGQFHHKRPTKHINELELRAILEMLQRGAHVLPTKCSILIRSDNTTAIAYVNHQRGRLPHLRSIASAIWKMATLKQWNLAASFIPGRENTTADRLSRVFDTDQTTMTTPTPGRPHLPMSPSRAASHQLQPVRHSANSDRYDWRVTPQGRQRWMKWFKVTHLQHQALDLFASPNSRQFPKFISRLPTADAMAVDAFTFTWNQQLAPLLYFCPPEGLLLRTLAKLRDDATPTAFVVAPKLHKAVWWPILMALTSNASIQPCRLAPTHFLPAPDQVHCPYASMRVEVFVWMINNNQKPRP